jgi:hypothetical protein
MADAGRFLRIYSFALSCILALGGAAVWQWQHRTICCYPSNFAEGDLIFRAGRGWQAAAVQSSSLSQWSHIGMLTRNADGGWRVIHAAVHDAAAPQMSGKVVTTSLAEFANVRQARAISVWRFSGQKAIATLAAKRAKRFAQMSVEFDNDFDLTDASKLYCTELIMESFRFAGVRLSAPLTNIDLPLLGGAYLVPKTFMASGDFHPVR